MSLERTDPILGDELCALRRLRADRFGSLNDRVFKTKQIAHSADYMAEPNHGNAAKLGGARSTVAVPMLKDDQLAS
jgi:hypothetical protein